MRGRWAGESSRCEDPAPTVGAGGETGVPIKKNDAARRVATVFETLDFLIKILYPQKAKNLPITD